MLQSELTKEQLDYCAEEIMRELSPDIDYDRVKMKKGLNLYRQGHVFNAKMEGRYIEAQVQDEKLYDVSLDLDVFVLSSCSCSVEGICRHKLATFFYSYAMVGRVGDFFQDWKSSKKLDITKARPKDLTKEEEEKSVIGEKVSAWYTYFKRSYHAFKEKHKQDRFSFNQLFLFESIYRVFFQDLRKSAPQTPFIKDLFIIHAAIYTMQKLVEESEQSKLSISSKDSYVYPYMSELLNNVYERLVEIKSLAIPLSAESLLKDTREHLSQLLFSGNEYQYERLMAYFFVWNVLLRKEWIQEEKAFLTEKKEEFIKRKQSFAVECQFALAHLAYLEKDDDAALKLLTTIQGNILRFYYFWIANLQPAQEWQRQRIWLDVTLEILEEHHKRLIDYHSKRNMTRQFLPYYEENAKQLDDPSSYEMVLKSLLPYSFQEFDHYLLENQNYDTWADLQMLVGYQIDEQPRELLKQIEAIDITVLIPLYHRAVNEAIKGRNRPSYKLAVRYLKKLRTYYKKLKQVERWDEFIDRLATEHKRLRAFQEELERGKLLHVRN
ncbi:SWIM zinc finger family protein [Bacillus suaedaesalsae]|uniref:SWIM zinc finger family protein n=1 Tax=Bacillus suaedaesalsae TaxID=2810349 RepID=A0ABS2DL11_9BACI|nr:SWIM zinc finger family protein [Bacillus suaedaesalsae]MBM6619169.1 SWIM zinc finger family protein [Bacillus suaedaesalsae]